VEYSCQAISPYCFLLEIFAPFLIKTYFDVGQYEYFGFVCQGHLDYILTTSHVLLSYRDGSLHQLIA